MIIPLLLQISAIEIKQSQNGQQLNIECLSFEMATTIKTECADPDTLIDKVIRYKSDGK